jgi:hypothetical protein
MAVHINVTTSDFGGKTQSTYGNITIDAGTVYAAGGFVIDFTTSNLGADYIKSTVAPLLCSFSSKGGTASLITYGWTPGTNITNNKMQIYTAGTEIAAGAVSAAVSSDVIAFELITLRQ